MSVTGLVRSDGSPGEDHAVAPGHPRGDVGILPNRSSTARRPASPDAVRTDRDLTARGDGFQNGVANQGRGRRERSMALSQQRAGRAERADGWDRTPVPYGTRWALSRSAVPSATGSDTP